MGRYSTGAKNIYKVQRIELRSLIKQFDFKSLWHGFKIYGYNKQILTWQNGSKVVVVVSNTINGLYMNLDYLFTTSNGEKTRMNYNVKIERKPSNLRAGEVLYFCCPVTNNLCRILYRAYGSEYFKCRKAYKKRLYYPAQMASKRYMLFTRMMEMEEKLNELSVTRNQPTFRGKLTKRQKRKEALFNKFDKLESMADTRWFKNFMK